MQVTTDDPKRFTIFPKHVICNLELPINLIKTITEEAKMENIKQTIDQTISNWNTIFIGQLFLFQFQ